MTDKEIIQALECCKMPVGSGSCNDCPFDYQREKRLTSTDESCTKLMLDYALDLINRQQAEIERLTINMNAFGLGMKQEKERADTIRAEAIKEFADELRFRLSIGTWKHKNVLLDDCKWIIDNLVKEMVGVDK